MDTDIYEEQILACILVDPERNASSIRLLDPHDFRNENHRAVFKEILKQNYFDLIKLAYDSGVGIAEIMRIRGEFLTHENIEYHIALIKNERSKRKIEMSLKELLSRSPDAQTYITELQGIAKNQVYHAAEGIGKSIGELLHLAENEMKEVQKNVGKRLFSPHNRFNSMCGAFMPGKLITIAGRTGAGKTAFAFHVVRHIAKHHAVTYISLEMTPTEMGFRVLASETGIPTIKMTNGNTDYDEEEKILSAIENCKHEKIKVTNAGRTVSEIVEIIVANKPDMIVIDSVNLMRNQGENERIRITNLTREIKQIALRYNIAVIMLCQLNRDADKSPIPTLSEIKESSSIEEDSDICLLLANIEEDDFGKVNDGYLTKYREIICTNSQYNELRVRGDRLAMIIIAKNRNGVTGMIPMINHAGRYLFKEM